MAEPFIENLEDLEAKSRETYYQIDCRTAGGVEAILEAGAKSIIEAVLEADGEEANEVILEADAEKADEAIETEETFIELVVEARLEAAREIFRNKAASRHTIVFRPS